MVPEQRVKTCTYKVCKMVPEQRVKTCTLQGLQDGARATREDLQYKVCTMVPEQRVKTCDVQGLQDGPRATREDLHLPGLQDGARAAREDLHLQGLQDGRRVLHQRSAYKVCKMVAEQCVKQVPYTVCKPVRYTKTINCTKLVAEAGSLHGDPLRAQSGLQAGSGEGLLPGARCPVVLRSPQCLRPRRLPTEASQPSCLLSQRKRQAWSSHDRRPNPRVGPPFFVCGASLARGQSRLP